MRYVDNMQLADFRRLYDMYIIMAPSTIPDYTDISISRRTKLSMSRINWAVGPKLQRDCLPAWLR